MHPKTFHAQIDDGKLVAALADAERNTNGRIYVFVSHHPVTDVMAAARRRFEKLGLSRLHEHRASVLIYIAPRTFKFAIIGDTAIHEKCGEEYWKELAEKFSHDLKFGELMPALLNAIGSLKGTMEAHFPVR
jgi:uncharacterized membrane protein